MYGLKRVEYDEMGRVSVVEFHPETATDNIVMTLAVLGVKLKVDFLPASLRELVEKTSDAHIETASH